MFSGNEKRTFESPLGRMILKFTFPNEQIFHLDLNFSFENEQIFHQNQTSKIYLFQDWLIYKEVR